MDLERDLFTVRAEKSRTHDFAMIRAIRKLGFDPVIMGSVAPPPTTAPMSTSSGPMPAVVAVALKRARAENKLLLIDFHASWCGPCKRMLEETWPSPLLTDVMARVVFLKVDTDEHPAVAQHFKVAGLPDARLLDRDGKQLLHLPGFQDAASTAQKLRPLTQSR